MAGATFYLDPLSNSEHVMSIVRVQWCQRYGRNERVFMNYIRDVPYIAGGDAALLLDRYESSFARSVVSNSDSSSILRDLDHV